MATYEIDYFELAAASPGQSRDFFTRAFGWSSLDYGPSYVEIRDAGVLGGVSGTEADHDTPPLIGIRTDDLEAAERAVIAAGGTIVRPPYDFPGGRRFHFREPGGNEMLVYREN